MQKGHGVPDSLLKEVKDAARTFFNLHYEEKLKIKMTSESGYRSWSNYFFVPFIIYSSWLFNQFLLFIYLNRGYQRIGENVTKGKPDMHEAIDVSWDFLYL